MHTFVFSRFIFMVHAYFTDHDLGRCLTENLCHCIIHVFIVVAELRKATIIKSRFVGAL
jgi:hypothetical protein